MIPRLSPTNADIFIVLAVSCLEKPFFQLKIAAVLSAAVVEFRQSIVPLARSRTVSVPVYRSVQIIVLDAYLKPLLMPPNMTL